MTTTPENIAPVLVESRRHAEPRLSVIIVTWNCRDLIGQCLDWLGAAEIDFPFETVVVDNASHDGTPTMLRARSDIDVLLLSDTNLGFGRGNNLGAQHARGEYLLLLNPDAFLQDPTTVARMATPLMRDPRVVAAGPKLVNTDGSHQVGDAGYAPTLTHLAAHQFLVSKLLPGVHGYYLNNRRDLSGAPVSVDWLSGACQMVRRSAFEAVGGFSREIFMYGEDVELGVRLKTHGGRLLYVPSIEVLHLQGATQKAADEMYVSTRWIDSLFASDVTRVRTNPVRRWILRAILIGGFGIRAGAYAAKAVFRPGRDEKAKANAMMTYASHSVRVVI